MRNKRGSVTLETALIFPLVFLLIILFISTFITVQTKMSNDLKKDDQCIEEWRKEGACRVWK